MLTNILMVTYWCLAKLWDSQALICADWKFFWRFLLSKRYESLGFLCGPLLEKKAKLLYCKYIPQVGKLLFTAVILAGNTNKVTPWFVLSSRRLTCFTSKSTQLTSGKSSEPMNQTSIFGFHVNFQGCKQFCTFVWIPGVDPMSTCIQIIEGMVPGINRLVAWLGCSLTCLFLLGFSHNTKSEMHKTVVEKALFF